MSKVNKTKNIKCSLVMPISITDGCSTEHWEEVRVIITEAVQQISDYNLDVKMASESDDVGIIQKHIVQNIYSADIVICDVSGKNANVMFELGMRLAFDKAIVIIKDDKTDYAFDTGIIEHIPYPRDLRFAKIVEFKRNLAAKVLATYEAAINDPTHSPFLKSFGSFQVAKLEENDLPTNKFILLKLEEIQSQINIIRRRNEVVGTRNRERLEFQERIDNLIEYYLRLNSELAIKDLIGNVGFFRFVASNFGYKYYFDSELEMTSAIDNILKQKIF